MPSLARPRLPVALLGALLVLICVASGCTPKITALYRDFEHPTDPADREAVLRESTLALEAAGWPIAPSPQEGTLRTERKTVQHRLIYRVQAWVEVIPVGERHVRVLLHPYRVYPFGFETKMGYMTGALERRLVAPLREAFEERGLEYQGTARLRDRGQV